MRQQKAPIRKTPGIDVVRRTLAQTLAAEIERQGLTQTEAARRAKDAPSQISLVTTGRLRGFSTDRLMRMVNGLGLDTDIVVRRTGGRTGKTRIVTRQ